MLDRFENFTALISDISRSIQKLERDEMERLGYRGAFAQYLLVLRKSPEGLSLAQLCEKSDRDKAAVSRILSEMNDKSLVAKPEGGSGYRAKYVLTDAGMQAAEFVISRAQSAVDAVGSSLSTAQREGMYESLSLIAANLSKLTKDGIPPEGGYNG